MYATLRILSILALATGGRLLAAAAPAGDRSLVRRYCAGCHNDQVRRGGLSLSKADPIHPELHAREWESAVRKLRAGVMPPAGAPRPDAATLRSFVAAVEKRIDTAAVSNPNPGRPSLHRLNRTEYANSVRDLLDVDVNVDALLPPDDMSHGFDNMSEVLNVSPTLIEAYTRAAGKISRTAAGDTAARPVVETYHVPSTLSQTRHINGTPYGTRGGISVRHFFPLDGEYRFRISLYFTTNTFLFGVFEKGERVDVSIDGKRVALLDVNPAMKVNEDLRTTPIRIPAGPHNVSVAFVQKAAGPVDDFVQPFEHSLGDLFLGRTQGLTGLPHVRDVGIEGPHNAAGPGNTPSRRKIFLCRPETDADELGCARRILSTFATKAYRRPASGSDVEELLNLYQRGRNQGGFESGIQVALQRILSSPQFVFRFERLPANVAPGSKYRINGTELASRLSYFLWSSTPDDRLLLAGTSGRITRDAVLDQEVRRMLADPRAESLATNFAAQWLSLRNLNDVQPDLFLFPNFNRNLLDSMRRETELLFWSIVRENRRVTDLLTSDYTYVDENLARHYGIPGVSGNEFRRVSVDVENRKGLLGHAGILTLTSFANRTSPVVRGKWVLDTILGVPPPRPPANVPPLNENAAGKKARPVRERLEEHRSNPACASCHQIMDPIGFALENFDATGSWRTRDSGFAVDPAGRLTDGTSVDSPASLRQALVQRSDAFVRTFAEKLLTFALGRGLEYYDMPAVRAIVREAEQNQFRFSAFVHAIVQSPPFQYRRAEEKKPGDTDVD